MTKNFWNKFKKPIFALAPMANVTDSAFRRIIAKYGKPDIIWTEFVSADGLFKGRQDILIKDLKFHKSERPIVAQFFTSNPEMMKKAAELARKLKFDGIDINMGCPDRSIERQSAGASLMKNPELAKKIIRAAKEGAGGLPVSVKTRIGYNKNELDKWLPEILSEQPTAVIIHARTRKEMSKVSANWENIKRAVEIRNNLKSKVLIIGNGDVKSRTDAEKKVAETGADGVMIGRAFFGNPWLLNKKINFKNITVKTRLKVLIEHTKLFDKLLGGIKNFDQMKKHFKAYVEGFDRAKVLRVHLMQTKNSKEVEKIVKSFLKSSYPKSNFGLE